MALRAAYGFLEGSGTTSANTVSGGAAARVVSGTVTGKGSRTNTVASNWVTGKNNNGVENSTDHVAGAVMPYNWGNADLTSWTTMAWFKVPSIPDGSYLEVMGYEDAGSEFFYLEYNRSGSTYSLAVGIEPSGGAWSLGGGISPINWDRTVWHHLAVVRSGTNVKVYVDGVMKVDATNAAATTPSKFHNVANYLLYPSTAPGASRSAADEYRMFDTALTQAEVATYAAEAIGPGSGGLTPDDVTNSGSGTNALSDRLTASVAVALSGSGSQAVSTVLSTSDAPTASSTGGGSLTDSLAISQAASTTGAGTMQVTDAVVIADAVSTTSTGTNAVAYRVVGTDAIGLGSTGTIEVVDQFSLSDEVTNSGSGQIGLTAPLAARDAVGSSGTGTVSATDPFSQADALEQSGTGQAVTTGTLAVIDASTPSGSGQSVAAGRMAGVEVFSSAGSGSSSLLGSVAATTGLTQGSGSSSGLDDTLVTTESFFTSGSGSNSVTDTYEPPAPEVERHTLTAVPDSLGLWEVPTELLTLMEVTDAYY